MGIFEMDTGATILIAVDFSEVSRSALQTGVAVAGASDDTVRAIHVVDVLAGDTAFWDFFERTEQLKAEVIARATAELQSFVDDSLGEGHGVELDVRFGRPTDNIAEAAAAEDVELLVVGTTGQSKFESAVFGSTASHLVHEVETPILMVSKDPLLHSPDKILAPVDFSDCSRRALLRAAQMARSSSGSVIAYNSLRSEPVSNSPYFTSLPSLDGDTVSRAIQDRFDRLEEMIEELGVADVTTIADVELTESAPRAILEEAAEHGVDLICLGSHGRDGLERLLLGSTAETVLRKSKLPVMVVRR